MVGEATKSYYQIIQFTEMPKVVLTIACIKYEIPISIRKRKTSVNMMGTLA